MELLKSLTEGERAGGFSYVYDTYSALKFAQEDVHSGVDEKLSALNTAFEKTTAMTRTLKRIYHNINRYVQQLVDKDDINAILAAHYDDFYHRIIEAHIQPLKIKDSIPKYKNAIRQVLDTWLDNEVFLAAEPAQAVVSKIFFIKESYEAIERDFLDEIDVKIRRYTRATTKKIEYLTNTDRTAQGNLIYLLTALARAKEDGELLNGIRSALDLYEQRYLSPNSLYHNKNARRRERQNPVLIEEPSDDLRSAIEAEYRQALDTPYHKQKVWAYLQNLFGEHPAIFSADFDIDGDHAYIMSLLAVLHGNDWLYFDKLLLEFSDINYLVGKNAQGKSTFLDALMIVLLGEANARNFNKAANDKAQRTLQRYLRADMDPHNPRSRKGRSFNTYIACEFLDDIADKSFTAGVIFDCYADGGERYNFFLYDGSIPEDCFIVGRKPMDIGELRYYLKERYKSRQTLYGAVVAIACNHRARKSIGIWLVAHRE